MCTHYRCYYCCNRRKKAEMVVNVITVHNCGRGANNESDTESLYEHVTHLIEGTSIDMASDVNDEILQGIIIVLDNSDLDNISVCIDTPQSAMQVLDKTVTCGEITTKDSSQTIIALKCLSIAKYLLSTRIQPIKCVYINIQLQHQYSWIMSNWLMLR